MKKIHIFMLLGMMLFVFAACEEKTEADEAENNMEDNAENESRDNTDNENGNANDEDTDRDTNKNDEDEDTHRDVNMNDEDENENVTNEDDNIEVVEVFADVLRFMDDVDSFTIDMDLQQEVSSDDEAFNTNVKQTIDMDADTSEMKIEGTEAFDSDDMEVPYDAELGMYAISDEFFYTDSGLDTWLHFEGDDSELVKNQLVNQPDPVETIGLLAGYQDGFEREDAGDSYILKLDASGEEYRDVQEDFIQSVIDMNNIGEASAQYEQTEFERYIFELEVDKETSELVGMTIDMLMNVDFYGDELTIDQISESTFSGYDEVDDIEVPDEVMDNLEEADEATVDQILG